jgi:linoleoyl-CoA desaturase
MERIKFRTNTVGSSFSEDVKKEVAAYFTTNKISQFANKEMLIKVFVWLSLWVVTWSCVILFKDFFWLAVLMGVLHMSTHLMIAFNIAHDANHAALFKSRGLNVFFGYFMEMIGCNRNLWMITHNQEHHTFINIHKYDNNIDGYKVLRLTPEDKWYSIHRFQWLYATIVYGLSTLNYATFRDLKMIYRYVVNKQVKINLSFVVEFVFFKIIYYSYLFIIPLFVFDVSFSILLTYFIVGHFLNGIALVFVFLTGHLTEDASFPKVENAGIENNWAVHVIQTTGDYSPDSKIFRWFIGSLNLHVAHHLFPKICHVHYNKITPIIKSVAAKHGYSYIEMPSFNAALISHYKLLVKLGKK